MRAGCPGKMGFSARRLRFCLDWAVSAGQVFDRVLTSADRSWWQIGVPAGQASDCGAVWSVSKSRRPVSTSAPHDATGSATQSCNTGCNTTATTPATRLQHRPQHGGRP